MSSGQPVKNVQNCSAPQLKMKNNLPVTAFCFISRITVPGTGRRVTAGAGAVLEGTWEDLRDSRLGTSLQPAGSRRG